MNQFLSERLSCILKLRENEKLTFKGICEIIGTGHRRAAQLYRYAKRLQERYKDGDPYIGLSARAMNCCSNAGLENRAQIEAAIKDGRLHPNNPKGCRNYGWKTHSEIYKWLGIPEIKKPKWGFMVCPHCGGKICDIRLPTYPAPSARPANVGEHS